MTCHYGSRDLEYPVPYSNAITLDLRFVSLDFKTDFFYGLLVAKLLYTYFLTVNPFASHSVTPYGKCDCFGFYSVGKLVVNFSKHKFLRIMMFCIIRQYLSRVCICTCILYKFLDDYLMFDNVENIVHLQLINN